MASPRSRGVPGGSGFRPPGLALVTSSIRSSAAHGLAANLCWPTKPGRQPHRIDTMSLSGMGRLDGRSAGLGAVAGVLAAGAALGVGQFVAGLTGASGSPVVVVGELQIDFTPPWLKNFAITEFGADDKLVLVTGIVVVLGAFAALVGAAATRRMAYGMAGIAVFAAVGLTAAATRPHATVASLLPTLAAIASAVAVLYLLIPLVRPSARPPARAVSSAPAVTGPAETGEPELAATDGS